MVRIFSNGFFVATVGDVELSGPLQISVDAPGLVLRPGEILRLLFWHTGDHKFDITTAKFCDFLNSYKYISCSLKNYLCIKMFVKTKQSQSSTDQCIHFFEF